MQLGGRLRRGAIALALASLGYFANSLQADAAPLALEDILRMEMIGRVELALGGNTLIYERIGPYNALPDYLPDDERYSGRLVVVDLTAPNTEAHAIALGDGTWIGSVSPGGERVAIYWRVGDVVNAGILDLRTLQVSQLRLHPIVDHYQSEPLWVSSTTILYSTTEGPEPSTLVSYRAAATQERVVLWSRAAEGIAPTPTVVSGGSGELVWRPGTLRAVDVETLQVRDGAAGRYANFSLSPNSRFLAALRQGDKSYINSDASTFIGSTPPFRPVVIDLHSFGQTNVQDACETCLSDPQRPQWSADSQNVAFYARLESQNWNQATVRSYNALSRTLTTFSLASLDLVSQREQGGPQLPQPAIPADGGVYVAARRANEAATSHFTPRHFFERVDSVIDWYFVQGNTAPRNLTSDLTDVSASIVARSPCGIAVRAHDEVWLLEPSGSAKRLDAALAEQCDIAVGLLPTLADRTASVRRPTQPSAVVAYADGQHRAVLYTSARGTRLSVFRASRPVYSETLNPHLGRVQPAREIQIPHTFHGTQLTSCLQVPGNARRASPPPLIVVAYPTASNRTTRECISNWRHGIVDAYTTELLVRRGYAVLYLAAPVSSLTDDGDPTANWGRLAQSAIDAVVNRGYARHRDIGVFGLSYGYAAAIAIADQMDGIGAAVAISGAQNFISHYGYIGPTRLLLSADFLSAGQSVQYEEAEVTRFGAPPWLAWNQYISSSALSSIERMQTPILLMHGDLDDNYPMSQSDEYFSALARLGQRVDYVVYWGEGHGNQSPANIRDAWRRIECWFDLHLHNQPSGPNECIGAERPASSEARG